MAEENFKINPELKKSGTEVKKEVPPEAVKEVVKEEEKIIEILKEEIPEEKKEISPEAGIPSVPVAPPVALKPFIFGPAPTKTIEEIEKILAEELEEIYFNLDEVKKMEFRLKGEEAASKIEILLNEVRVRVKEILKLIVNWLKIIPGINKFFLEQEAKIKTDKILRLKRKL